MKDIFKKGSIKIEDAITRANVEIHKVTFASKSVKELEKLLKEKREANKLAQKKMREDGLLKTLSIIDDGINISIVFLVPGGIPLAMVKKSLGPIKILSYQEIALRELIKEKNKGVKKTMIKEQLSKLSTEYSHANYIEFKDELCSMNPNAVLENVSIISVNEDACGLFANYTNLNAAVMTTPELANIYSDAHSIECMALKTQSINCSHLDAIKNLKSNIASEINERLEGRASIRHMYCDSIRANSLIMPIEKSELDSCRLGLGASAKTSVKTLSKYLRESYVSKDKTVELLTGILPLTNKLVLTESTDLGDIMKTPMVIKKNIMTEAENNPNLMAYKYILNEACAEVASIDNTYTRNLNKLRDEVTQLCEGLVKAKVTNISNVFDIDYSDVAPELLKYETMENLYNFTLSNSEDEQVIGAQLESFIKSYNSYVVACEATNMKKGSKSLAWKAGHAVEKKTRDILNNGKDAYDTSGRNNAPIKKAGENIEKLTNHPINEIIKMDKDERRKRLIEGRFRLRIWKLLRKAVLSGGLMVIAGPVIAGITMIGSFALDKRLDKKVKNEIIHEMETELKIVDEKIEDSKGDRHNKEKYQLMRLKAKLEKEIDRIKLGLGAKY